RQARSHRPLRPADAGRRGREARAPREPRDRGLIAPLSRPRAEERERPRTAGSLSMASVRIGRVGRAHGVRGEVTVDECDLTADELLRVAHVTWRGRNGDERSLVVESARPANPRLLVRFAGVADREQARELGLRELHVDAERLPDPGPGMAYAFQLIGLEVETESGARLGVLDSILATGAHPVYVVHGEREWMVPATPDVVRRVDLARRVITVALPAGL